MNKEFLPVISICISTYGRASHIESEVKRLLSSNSSNFELIVLDNNSPDNTKKLLANINDTRFVFISKNDISSDKTFYDFANGEYIVTCTDKDVVDLSYVDEIANFLSNNKNIAVGFFVPNYSTENYSFNLIKSKVKALSKYCFNGNHPSGFFYRRDDFIKNNIPSVLGTFNSCVNAYWTDFVSSLMCNYGDFCVCNVQFIKHIEPPFDGLESSYTYSEAKNNLFFTPEYRFEFFNEYMKLIKSFNLSPIEYYLASFCFLKKIIKNCTLGYISILNNAEICRWYSMSQGFIEKELRRDLVADCIKKIINLNYIDFCVKLCAIIYALKFQIKVRSLQCKK